MCLSAASKMALISLSRGPVSALAAPFVDRLILSCITPTKDCAVYGMYNIYRLLQEIIHCAMLSKLKISSPSVDQDC
jgi:hypothetical protein